MIIEISINFDIGNLNVLSAHFIFNFIQNNNCVLTLHECPL